MSTIDPSTSEPRPETDADDVFPDQIMIQLAGIADTCREGLLALAVQAGLATMTALMAEEATGLCGSWNARDTDRSHQRGGSTPTSVTLGGQRVPTRRPRVRVLDDDGTPAGEAKLETYTHFADTDLLTRVVTERMLAGVATRDFTRVSEPIGTERRSTARSTSKSAVSRRFVSGTRKALDELLQRDLTGIVPVVLMLDGIIFASQATVVALIITAEGKKIPVGIAHGDTENTVVVEGLLRSMLDRGLNIDAGVLVVVDGGKALKAGVTAVFGDRAVFQRCTVHKRRNIKGYLAKKDQGEVDRRLRAAFNNEDPKAGRRQADRLLSELEKSYPSAASSLAEGLGDMFTVRGLGVDGPLARSLTTTNMIESMFSTVASTSSNVKRWRDGEMRMRWIAAGLLEAEKSFNRVKGHRQLLDLAAAISRRIESVTPAVYSESRRQAA